MAHKNPHAVALGKKGGRAKSKAKAAAARENGKKGGRHKQAGEALKAAVDSLGATLRRVDAARAKSLMPRARKRIVVKA